MIGLTAARPRASNRAGPDGGGMAATTGIGAAGLLRAAAWLAVFAAILAAWAALYEAARMSGVDWLGRPAGPATMPMEDWATLAPMWSVMMAAMMLPVMAPALATYEMLIRSADGTRRGWAGLLAGYLGAWLAFAVLIAAMQVGLMRAGLLDRLGATTSLWLTAGLLAVVGLYQFTGAKRACHGVCLTPMAYFLGRWRPGTWGGARMGLGMGGFCVGCCWGFMALGFVGGVMSLLWMGAATVFMVIERLPAIGARVGRPMGAALVASGAAVAARAAGLV